MTNRLLVKLAFFKVRMVGCKKAAGSDIKNGDIYSLTSLSCISEA